MIVSKNDLLSMIQELAVAPVIILFLPSHPTQYQL